MLIAERIETMLTDEASVMYRVESGVEMDLSAQDPSDKGLWEDGSKSVYEAVMLEKLDELKALQNLLFAEGKHKVLIVVQAMDTGGKDGCAKNVFSSMDPQGVHVKSFKAPHEEELAYDFLWRVHKAVPPKGMISVFIRSHYEDIVAVRVKELFPDQVWKRRYRHIVDFERMLSDEGTKIVKIFLNISKDEQRERLQARLDDPAKLWKFEPDDLADRARWDEFMVAYSELISKTSYDYAPWHVVPSDRKWYRNLVVAQIVINALKELKMEFPEVKWNPEDMHVE